jgi:hypothetical protein
MSIPKTKVGPEEVQFRQVSRNTSTIEAIINISDVAAGHKAKRLVLQ